MPETPRLPKKRRHPRRKKGAEAMAKTIFRTSVCMNDQGSKYRLTVTLTDSGEYKLILSSRVKKINLENMRHALCVMCETWAAPYTTALRMPNDKIVIRQKKTKIGSKKKLN
jgi:hypothetical protein